MFLLDLVHGLLVIIFVIAIIEYLITFPHSEEFPLDIDGALVPLSPPQHLLALPVMLK
jgi:hypothetical protein